MVGPPLTADKPAFLRSTDQYPPCRQSSVREVCLPLRAKEEISMARKVGQIIARGDRRWLIRVYLGRDHKTKKRKQSNDSGAHARGAGIPDEEAART